MSLTNAARRLPKVLIVAGYFDWFSGYQETALARAMASLADTYVLAGDRVSPIFSDEQLERIGQQRRYPANTRVEHGVTVTRLATRELRSMVWAPSVPRTIADGNFDVIVQVMPGQLFPALASLARNVRRVVLYGDNKAMYAGLPPAVAAAKFAVFCATKGALYTAVNLRADHVYGYTKDTIRRLRAFHPGTTMTLFPLTYDENKFFYSPELRESRRHQLGFREDDVVILGAGKVNAQKRLDLLVDAFHQARDGLPQLRLVLAGFDDGPVAQSLRDDVVRRGVANFVTILPFVDSDELNALFNASDLGVWPRMPAVTIQQALGTGLDVLIPNNDFTDHLFYSDLRSHEVRNTRSGERDSAPLASSFSMLASDLPRSDTDRQTAAYLAKCTISARSLCQALLENVVERS
ncbi:glycosyltransferase [Flexivirga alba]|uniref:D-inositol 3-phosphate glycosyltransferase n=1 Tax=Flexivirga alba TaxID=702742 RepID=A0ABW2AFP9_9MICO